MNIGDQPWPDPVGAARRVRDMQVKLHHWAVSDPDRRFDDVFNLVAHPDFLTVAWERVRGNKGARTAGVDRVSPAAIAEDDRVEEFLGQVRELLRSRMFAPLPVRERLIPKPNSTKLRRLGIPTAMDRVVQASLLLLLEPIFEADERARRLLYLAGSAVGRDAAVRLCMLQTSSVGVLLQHASEA